MPGTIQLGVISPHVFPRCLNIKITFSEEHWKIFSVVSTDVGLQECFTVCPSSGQKVPARKRTVIFVR